MNQTTRFFAATAMALASFSSFASAPTDLGTIQVGGTAYFGNTFNQALATFTDVYTFKVAADSQAAVATNDGSAVSWKFFNVTYYFRDVNISKVELLSNGVSLFSSTYVPDSYSFQFSNLSQGVQYTLNVTGSVSGSSFGSSDTASYDGFIATAPSVASGAPEASDALMAAMGLVGVGFWARARKASAK